MEPEWTFTLSDLDQSIALSSKDLPLEECWIQVHIMEY